MRLLDDVLKLNESEKMYLMLLVKLLKQIQVDLVSIMQDENFRLRCVEFRCWRRQDDLGQRVSRLLNLITCKGNTPHRYDRFKE